MGARRVPRRRHVLRPFRFPDHVVARGRHWLLGLVCGAGAGASIATMAVLYDHSDPSRAYYGTDGRAHLLLIGAGLALILARWTPQRAARSTVNALGLAGAVACVAFWAL